MELFAVIENSIFRKKERKKSNNCIITIRKLLYFAVEFSSFIVKFATNFAILLKANNYSLNLLE